MAENYSWYKSSCLEVNCMVSHFVLPVASLIALFFCWSSSWGRAGRVLRWKRRRGRTHYSHVGLFCLSNGSREPFSPPAPHVSTGSNAAHKMPVNILRKTLCFNKEKHNRDRVGSVCLKNTELHNERGFLRQHLQEHNGPYCPQALGSTLHCLCNKFSSRLSVATKISQIS